ncbi:MAG: 3-deoxy-7-phosphoheptulonate synthase [Candidatus Omnitrophota bacterium]
MIVVLKPGVTDEQIQHIVKKAEQLGLKAHISRGVERSIIGFIGPEDVLRVTPLEVFPGVESVLPVLSPYKLVSKEFKKQPSEIRVKDGVVFGGKKVVMIAGPCSIESHESLLSIARKVKAAGATVLRGGAFKPRTSPYEFQGLGEEGLRIMREVGDATGLSTITEVIDPRQVELVDKYVDIFQIGARNMQNFSLLKEVGRTNKPVVLKRGMSALIKEWLMCAEYIMSEGNPNVIFCERGIRTFETETRNTLDINTVPVIKEKSHLPVIVDPSHAAGRWGLIPSASMAAIAAGADGLMVEVHENPEEAKSDGAQSLLPKKFEQLVNQIRAIAEVVGRSI